MHLFFPWLTYRYDTTEALIKFEAREESLINSIVSWQPETQLLVQGQWLLDHGVSLFRHASGGNVRIIIFLEHSFVSGIILNTLCELY